MFTAQPIILGRILLQFGLMYAPEGKKPLIQVIQNLNKFSLVFLQD